MKRISLNDRSKPRLASSEFNGHVYWSRAYLRNALEHVRNISIQPVSPAIRRRHAWTFCRVNFGKRSAKMESMHRQCIHKTTRINSYWMAGMKVWPCELCILFSQRLQSSLSTSSFCLLASTVENKWHLYVLCFAFGDSCVRYLSHGLPNGVCTISNWMVHFLKIIQDLRLLYFSVAYYFGCEHDFHFLLLNFFSFYPFFRGGAAL